MNNESERTRKGTGGILAAETEENHKNTNQVEGTTVEI
jgi:hypothetical protein